jgi:hypothetical protein
MARGRQAEKGSWADLTAAANKKMSEMKKG